MSRVLEIFLILSVAVTIGCNNDEKAQAPSKAIPDGPNVKNVSPNPNKQDPIDLTGPGQFAFGSTPAIIVDTRLFEQQIVGREPFQGEIKSSSIGRPTKIGKPKLAIGPANQLQPGFTFEQKRIEPLANFPGIVQTGWNPPDPALAVGPNHIVQTVNQSVAFFSKDGTLLFQQRLNDTDTPGFFDDVNAGSFVFDPKCFYDHYINRFFVLGLEVYQDIDEAYITFAISDDNDPVGVWYKYRTNAVIAVNDSTYWVDYPGLGFDANGFYVTGNLFNLTGPGGFGGALFRSFDKTPLLTGQPAIFTDIRDGSNASVQVAQHFGGDNAAPYFVSRASSSQMRITALNNALTAPSFTIENVSVPNGSLPPPAPNGGNGSLSTLDGRMMNVQWRNGSLWTCHAIASGNGSNAVARWYEIATGIWPLSGLPSLVQSGEIDAPGGASTFFPAIYSDEFDNAAIVVAHSSNSEFASVQAAGRFADDPTGQMSSLTLLQSGETSASGRWGDYFDIALDPVDGTTFWMVGEYVAADGSWRSSINNFSVFILGDINRDGVVNLLDVGPFVDLLANSNFGLAADINGDGVVNLLDVNGFIDLLSN